MADMLVGKLGRIAMVPVSSESDVLVVALVDMERKLVLAVALVDMDGKLVLAVALVDMEHKLVLVVALVDMDGKLVLVVAQAGMERKLVLVVAQADMERIALGRKEYKEGLLAVPADRTEWLKHHTVFFLKFFY